MASKNFLLLLRSYILILCCVGALDDVQAFGVFALQLLLELPPQSMHLIEAKRMLGASQSLLASRFGPNLVQAVGACVTAETGDTSTLQSVLDALSHTVPA
jgi:hypothetical protein